MSEYLDGLDLLPHHMREGMQRWIENGIPPCSFLMAVLRNDFIEACGKADDINQRALFNYAAYLHNFAPPACYGSPANVAAWKGLLTKAKTDE
jgi:hypothetical protein